MKEWEKGYVAAIIDGEGTLSIDKFKTCQGGLGGRLRIVNTSKSLLEHLRNMIGKGNVHVLKRNVNEPQKKILYEYYLGKKTGLSELLPQISECLFLKREHAKTMMEFFSLSRGKTKEKQDLYLKLKVLNKRGS